MFVLVAARERGNTKEPRPWPSQRRGRKKGKEGCQYFYAARFPKEGDDLFPYDEPSQRKRRKRKRGARSSMIPRSSRYLRDRGRKERRRRRRGAALLAEPAPEGKKEKGQMRSASSTRDGPGRLKNLLHFVRWRRRGKRRKGSRHPPLASCPPVLKRMWRAMSISNPRARGEEKKSRLVRVIMVSPTRRSVRRAGGALAIATEEKKKKKKDLSILPALERAHRAQANTPRSLPSTSPWTKEEEEGGEKVVSRYPLKRRSAGVAAKDRDGVRLPRA